MPGDPRGRPSPGPRRFGGAGPSSADPCVPLTPGPRPRLPVAALGGRAVAPRGCARLQCPARPGSRRSLGLWDVGGSGAGRGAAAVCARCWRHGACRIASTVIAARASCGRRPCITSVPRRQPPGPSHSRNGVHAKTSAHTSAHTSARLHPGTWPAAPSPPRSPPTPRCERNPRRLGGGGGAPGGSRSP
jgi:hypothetical protein